MRVTGYAKVFQSTRPIRGATGSEGAQDRHGRHFNPRAPYGARPVYPLEVVLPITISIHAPHTGRDGRRKLCCIFYSISIHAPHTGRDAKPWASSPVTGISIHAPHTGRDAFSLVSLRMVTVFQSTRPIRGATRASMPTSSPTGISIHAPHTGRDKNRKDDKPMTLEISIHAPHTGRDCHRRRGGKDHQDFNPRAPYGARRWSELSDDADD